MMAQGVSAPTPSNGVIPSLTAAELREILEYERILQFRDAVLAGTHPRVKIPAHLAKNRNVSTPNNSTPAADTHVQPSNSTPSNESSFYNKSPNAQRSTGNRVPISSQSEINPILLEKSDDLIKAEIQLQRQRLERALREQIEQQRIAAKALLQTSESLPNFDLTEVLSKALAIVHPSTTAEVDPSVGARSSASDSFDENTFYSSQHDTPEPSPSSQSHREPLQNGSLNDENLTEVFSKHQGPDEDVVITGISQSHSNLSAAGGNANNQNSYLQNQASIASVKQGGTDLSNSYGKVKSTSELQSSGKGSRPQDSSTGESNPVSDESDFMADTMAAQEKATSRQGLDDVAPSPLIRNHNLSPIAPQPARVSPLATARDPPVLREAIITQDVQPAQLTALRNIPGISSTDSSPKGTRKPEKKKEKKRKRKGKEIAGSPDSPYIKPEPKSPSPFAVAPLPRPQKRQRQSGQYSAELNYDDSRAEPEQPLQRPLSIQYDGHSTPIYEVDGDYTRAAQPISTHRRIDSGNEVYRRISGNQYVRQPEPTYPLGTPYGHGEFRPLRTASASIERRPYDDGQYYREPIVRASVRPDADRERSRSPIAMGPPRQAMRVVIDEHGRKYYEPAPVPVVRQSVAPPLRYREEEVVFARPPARTVVSRAMEGFEDEGMIVHRGSPSIVVPRRVVTQPEYTVPPPPDYRAYRQREYSVRPTSIAPPGDDYVQVRGPPPGNRRPITHLEEPPREYIQRAASIRPEPPRYEIPQEYVRMQSVHPEAPPREYAASVRPEARREMVLQGQREYSVRPNNALPRRELQTLPENVRYYDEAPVRTAPRQERVIVQEDGRYYEEIAGRPPMEVPGRIVEGERYYAEQPIRRPAEIQYIERPRAREASVVVYTDDPRASVYR